MSGDVENLQLPLSFTGIVRLFPLPNLVLFPGVIQPLHIFEMRYRQMMEDALAGDELLAIALMKPGWESDYEDRPPIYSTVCVGRIMTHSRLEDGRFNLLLQGLKRAKIVREISTERMYRMAEVSVCDDAAESECERHMLLAQKIRRQFSRLCQRDTSLDADSIQCLLRDNVRLELLADLIAFSLDANPLVKQTILEVEDLGTRLEIVSRQLERQLNRASAQHAGFPPCFSAN
jgi:Lon protease-like protein